MLTRVYLQSLIETIQGCSQVVESMESSSTSTFQKETHGGVFILAKVLRFARACAVLW